MLMKHQNPFISNRIIDSASKYINYPQVIRLYRTDKLTQHPNILTTLKLFNSWQFPMLHAGNFLCILKSLVHTLCIFAGYKSKSDWKVKNKQKKFFLRMEPTTNQDWKVQERHTLLKRERKKWLEPIFRF